MLDTRELLGRECREDIAHYQCWDPTKLDHGSVSGPRQAKKTPLVE
jgi:hypothetical protein